ncbi:MAG: serine/threonine-protein kinase [Planctomycetes bacterium]|nr:serine/threonine-protein kinase [Planctomycetota bacterium]
MMKFAYATGSRPLDGYTIKRGIGVGGFGEVYFATSDAGKEVALKRIQRNMDVELRGVRHCLNLKHANLISLWDIRHDDDGEAWVVMEYVPGDSLREVIESHPQGMPIEKIHDWFEGIAAGVAYLHDHGIVHRDLKPGNIFLDEDAVKIGDYGLAKFISGSHPGGQTESVGTFHYMAPEIGKGIYGKEIDTYALGIILYEMLTGRVPFDGESSQEILMKHLTADPDLSVVSEPYRSVIQVALTKDPELRYSCVGDMLLALKGQEPLTKPGAKPPRQPPPPEILIEDNQAGPLIINDEQEDIVMGDVKEVINAEPIHDPPPLPNPNRRQSTNEATVSFTNEKTPSEQTPTEPIAKAVKGGLRSAADWWTHGSLSTPVKTILLLLAAVLVIINAQWLVPGCVLLVGLYLIYYGGRSVILLRRNSREQQVAKEPEGKIAGATSAERARPGKKFILRESLKQRSVTERLMELTGALLMSAAVSAVVCLVATLATGIANEESFGSVSSWSMFTWLTLTSVSGTWVVLVLGKLFESSKGVPLRRRLVSLASGLLVGLLAFGFTAFLQQPLRFEMVRPLAEVYALPNSISTGNEVMLPGFLLFFGGLFVILRWWKQADPLRRSRLSIFATGFCVLWALLIDVFPQPWGVVVAGTMSVAIQLSAPWLDRKERTQILRQSQTG